MLGQRGCADERSTFWNVTTIGLQELRRRPAEVLRRVEDGEEVTIAVSGRPRARLVPCGPLGTRTWRRWSDVADVFSGSADPRGESDRDLVDGTLREP